MLGTCIEVKGKGEEEEEVERTEREEEERKDSQSHQRALPGVIPEYEEANYNSGWYLENNPMMMLPA